MVIPNIKLIPKVNDYISVTVEPQYTFDENEVFKDYL